MSKLNRTVKLTAITVLSVFWVFSSPLLGGDKEQSIVVMTRNMYPGADLAPLAFAHDEQEFQYLLGLTITDVLQSRIPKRAAQVAAEITQKQPDLIALQEVARWKIKALRGTIVLDQLELLLEALHKRGQHYKVAVVQELTEVEIPDTVAYTDRDAILVRSDKPLKILGTESHIYENLIGFELLGQPLEIMRGWLEVDVRIHGSKFKFVNTHLESPLDPVYTRAVQEAQANELLADLSLTDLPIILAGDFNSDAEDTHLYPLDATLSYHNVVAAGFNDVWETLYPSDHGYTWPVEPELLERIDLVFSLGFEAIAIERIGLEPEGGLYPSDHLGAVATLALE